MRKNLHTILAALLCAIIGLLSIGAGQESEREVSAGEVKELKAQIRSLEKKIAELEKRPGGIVMNPNTQAWAPKPPVYPLPTVKLQPPISSGRQGEIWGRGECNGWIYHLIPFNHGEGSKC